VGPHRLGHEQPSRRLLGRSAYAYPNKPTYSVQLWGPGGIQNGVHVAELEDTCFVLTNVNGAC
jgi:hypothetical protein